MTADAPAAEQPQSPVNHDVAPIQLPHRQRIEILIAVLLGIFLAALDQTIVGTALPVIVSELQGNDVYVWAFTAYLLTATISGPIYGKLSDIFGRRIIFTIGVSIFLIGSVLCSLSQEMWQFIVFRGIQGLGAGALFPVALAVIGDIFAPSERGRYQGFFGAVFGVSTLVGPALGGLITDNFGWHWIFLVNVPIGLVVLVVIWRTLPTRIASDVDRHIDYLGASVLAFALVPLLIGFTNKQFGEWTDLDVGGLIALGLLLIPVFVFVESRAKEPILPLPAVRHPRLHRQRDGLLPGGHGLLRGGRLPAALVPGGERKLRDRVRLPDPAAVCWASSCRAIATGQIVSATKRYKALTVTALLVTALGLFLLTNIRPDTPEPMLWLWMAITGLGIGPTFAVFTLVVQNAAPVRFLGTATSSLTLFQQVGGTIGLAIAGTIFGSVVLEEVPKRMVEAGVPEQFAGQASGGSDFLNSISQVGDLGAAILAQVPDQFKSVVEPLIPAMVNAIHQSISIATGATFVLGIVTALLAALVVLIVMPAGKIGERPS